MVVEKKLYTVEAFEAFTALPQNRDRHFELIHGEIVEKSMPTQRQGIVAANIITPIHVHTKQHNLGRIASEVRHRMPGDQHNARQPDIAFYADTTTPVVEKGAVLRMPDLAIEIKSPDDSLRELREKAHYYLDNGTRLVWLVYPEKRLIEVYAKGKDVDILTENDMLDGGDVLPGFSLPVRDIFAD